MLEGYLFDCYARCNTTFRLVQGSWRRLSKYNQPIFMA